MFTIYGGATEFNQWDLNQRVSAPGLLAGDKVVFQNSSGMTYPMKAYNHNGVVVVDVPNIILTMALPVVVYINDHCHETRARFNVVAQDKPEDYVFVDNDDWPSDVANVSAAFPKVINLTDYSSEGFTLNLMVLSLFEAGGGESEFPNAKNFWEDVSTEQALRFVIDGTEGNMPFKVRIDGVMSVINLDANHASNWVGQAVQVAAEFRMINPSMGINHDIAIAFIRENDDAVTIKFTMTPVA